jgi:hypothetical protein
MIYYDLCITWNWEYDADFVRLLEEACQARGLSLLQVTPHNLPTVWQALISQKLTFRAFFDRASDEYPLFLPLAGWAQRHCLLYINAREQAIRAWDKAAMHWRFGLAGIRTPYTVILPPFNAQPELPPADLSPLGQEFTIKPACRGGGQGVVNGANSWAEVLAARQKFPGDKYLLQSRVVPAMLGMRPAWFRAIYCVGQVHLCWWNPQTHVYAPLHSSDEAQYALTPLRDTASQIACICGLDLFSSELALTSEGDLVAVDYVNDPIDLRLQSKAHEGVPDEIVCRIAEQLALLASPARRKGDS